MTKTELEYASSLSILPYRAIQGTSMEKDWYDVKSGNYAKPEEPVAEKVEVTAPAHPTHPVTPVSNISQTGAGLSIGFQGGGKTAS